MESVLLLQYNSTDCALAPCLVLLVVVVVMSQVTTGRLELVCDLLTRKNLMVVSWFWVRVSLNIVKFSTTLHTKINRTI